MRAEIDACSYSQSLMSYLDDSHFPGSQESSASRGVLYKLSVSRVSSEHDCSTIEGKRDHEYHDSSRDFK